MLILYFNNLKRGGNDKKEFRAVLDGYVRSDFSNRFQSDARSAFVYDYDFSCTNSIAITRRT